MRPLLAGKIVAITGAGRGLGRAYALEMARCGAKVVVNDLGCPLDGQGIDPSVARAVVDQILAMGGEAVASTEDVGDFDAARRVIELATTRFGGLDVLVNNAGILRDAPLLEMRDEDWQAVLGVHLGGTFACSRAAAEVMVDQEHGGVILNTVSLAGMRGNVGQCNYAAAKAGIFGLTRALALELGLMGIRVNAVAPVAQTRMSADAPFIPETMQPAQIAPLICFLASDLAQAINGRVFGMHGDVLFEYAMDTSVGASDEAWTPEAIAEKLDAVAFDPTPREPSDAAKDDAYAARIEALFVHLEAGFRPRRARRWNTRLLFQISGCGRFTLTVKDGVCSVERGRAQQPTSAIDTDGETFWQIATGALDPNRAIVEGKLRPSELVDVFHFERAFDLRKVCAAAGLKEKEVQA